MSTKQADSGTNGTAQEAQELEIVVDVMSLTFGDLEMAMTFDPKTTSILEIMPFLNRVVKGGVKHLPLTAMPQIMDAITQALTGLTDQKNLEPG